MEQRLQAVALMEKILARFVAHYESCVQDIENIASVIRVF